MLTDLFEYHYEFNKQLIEQITTNINILPERTYPLFSHVLNAHQIWNARILNQESFDVWQVNNVKECKSINETNYFNTIKIMATIDLNSTLNYQNSKGEMYSNLISDILIHIANHSTHHKGQIISDFRSVGIEPLVTDYIFYKRK